MLEHIQKELRLASEIQRSMLPRQSALEPLSGQVEVHALLEPARTVGGDLYDFFVAPGGRLCFLVGDVSDKGVPAALFMARAVDIVRVVARVGGRDHPDAAWILEQANAELCENNDAGMFVTLFLGVLDPASGNLDYCNAGHVAPRLLRGGRVTALDSKRFPPLGVRRKAAYASAAATLLRGDLVFLCTDGVTEAENGASELFREERMDACLAASASTAREAVTSVVNAVHEHTGEGRAPSDDITVLALRLTGVTRKG